MTKKPHGGNRGAQTRKETDDEPRLTLAPFPNWNQLQSESTASGLDATTLITLKGGYMRKSDVFRSRFFKAADLKNGRLTVKISEVVMESIVDGEDDQPVVYFEAQTKGLVLNVTNWNMLEELSGSEESDDWIGMTIVLYVAKVDFQGRRVDAIRIAPAPRPSGGAQKPLLLADKADQPKNDCDENDPDTEPDAEGSPWEKKVAGAKS